MKTTQFPATVAGVSERMSGFVAHLRYNGYLAGFAETEATLNALQFVEAQEHQQVRLACKAVCAKDKQSYDNFDELFDSYWFNRGRERSRTNATQAMSAENRNKPYRPGLEEQRELSGQGTADQPDTNNDDGESAHEGEGRLIASKISNREKTDFRELITPESLEQAEKTAYLLAKAIRDRRSRRFRAAKQANRLNLRKTIRDSVKFGGVPMKLHCQNHPDRPVKIVALLDVSGSMSVYAKVFLSFIKGLMSCDTRADAYLFHTKLVRIGDALRDHDTLRAMNRLSLMAQGFGGGTKIGSNLKLFNDQYAMSCVDGRTVVIIMSDGYDTDPPHILAEALERLAKRNCKIIWLNPLKGWKDYAPVAQGMAAAMPWLDHFAAANTLESLANLEPALRHV